MKIIAGGILNQFIIKVAVSYKKMLTLTALFQKKPDRAGFFLESFFLAL
jgi:hypothetical protein